MRPRRKEIENALTDRGIAPESIAIAVANIEAEVPIADYLARRDAETTAHNVAFAERRRAHIARALDEADPDGVLRASYDAAGSAWREALERQTTLAAELEQLSTLRPTTEKAYMAQQLRRNALLNDLDTLAAALPLLDRAHQAADRQLQAELGRVIREARLAASRVIVELREQHERDQAAAREHVGDWQSLLRQIERGDAASLLDEV